MSKIEGIQHQGTEEKKRVVREGVKIWPGWKKTGWMEKKVKSNKNAKSVQTSNHVQLLLLNR